MRLALQTMVDFYHIEYLDYSKNTAGVKQQ